MIYSENDLIIPALNYLLLNKETGLTTSQLIALLSQELEVSGKDAEIISSRCDTYFSQKVRNLVSHKNLINKGLATYDGSRNGLHKITVKGEKYLLNNINNFAFIISNNFNERQREEIIEKDYSDLIVEEGFIKFGQVKNKTRSRKLVEVAKNHYAIGGKLYCSACHFNFEDFYGDIGKGYIEIHHLKPIFSYEGGKESLLLDALKNVTPVCCNCHKMIHRKNDELLSITSLKEIIKANGAFSAIE